MPTEESSLEFEKSVLIERLERERDEAELMADIQLKRSIELEYLIKNVNKIDESQFKKYDLTNSEINIIRILIGKSASNLQIAQELGIKITTVKTHLYNIYNKVGIDTRHELFGVFLI